MRHRKNRVRFATGTFQIEALIDNNVGKWFVINGDGITINNARQMAVPAHNSGTNESGIILLTPVLDLPGDINGDGKIDQQDLGLLLSAFGSCSGEPGYLPAADLDGDGCIGQGDLGILLANWTG